MEKKTLEKQKAQELARQIITAQLQPILDAQIAQAVGLHIAVVRDARTGRFLRRARKKDIERGVASGEEIIEIWVKEPSTGAARDLLDRALDKPREHVEMEMTGDWERQVARLTAARGRAAAYDKEKG